MKLFLISNLYPSQEDLDYGIFVKNIEDELVKNGAEITQKAVISGRAKSASDKLRKYRKFYSQIIAAYKKDDFDLVYLHFLSHSSPGLLLAKFLFGKKKKFIVNVHGSDVLKFNKNLLKWCNHRLLDETDLLVVPSPYFKEVIQTVFPDFPIDKIYISPSGGIDVSLFSYQKKAGDKYLHLGFVSRIEDDKGWLTFLGAVKELKNRNVPIKASVAGMGSKVEDMINQIKIYELEKDVDYLKILSHGELSMLYRNLDLFIFPTRASESLGLVGVEAMACGVPVIGTEIGGLKTFIEDGKNGFFTSIGDEIELVDKIQLYYNLSEIEKNKIKEAAVKTAQKYDRIKVGKELYSKFYQVIAKSR